MTTATDREALALYPFDGSDPNLILALHAAFRAGAEFAAEHAAPSAVPEAAVEAAMGAAARHSTTAPPPHENREVCCGECGEAIAYPGLSAEQTSDRNRRHIYRAALTAALPLLTAAPSATREEVHTITLTPIDVDLEALTAYFEGATDEMLLRVRRNHDPKED